MKQTLERIARGIVKGIATGSLLVPMYTTTGCTGMLDETLSAGEVAGTLLAINPSASPQERRAARAMANLSGRNLDRRASGTTVNVYNDGSENENSIIRVPDITKYGLRDIEVVFHREWNDKNNDGKATRDELIGVGREFKMNEEVKVYDRYPGPCDGAKFDVRLIDSKGNPLTYWQIKSSLNDGSFYTIMVFEPGFFKKPGTYYIELQDNFYYTKPKREKFVIKR